MRPRRSSERSEVSENFLSLLGARGREPAQAIVGDRGEAWFERIPQGTYELTSWTRDGKTRRRIHVPRQVEVDLR